MKINVLKVANKQTNKKATYKQTMKFFCYKYWGKLIRI